MPHTANWQVLSPNTQRTLSSFWSAGGSLQGLSEGDRLSRETPRPVRSDGVSTTEVLGQGHIARGVLVPKYKP